MKLSGKLASGMKWTVDIYTGEVEVYGQNATGEMEWMVPYWDTLTVEERDKLAAIGSELNDLHLPEKAKKWGESFADAYFDAIFCDGEIEEWRGMDYEAFHQALVNANNPPFYGDADKDCAMEIFGEVEPEDEDRCRGMLDENAWLGEIIIDAAYDAAWDACQKYLERA